jgi:two-component system, NarL family, sensor histidine kinase UhpB
VGLRPHRSIAATLRKGFEGGTYEKRITRLVEMTVRTMNRPGPREDAATARTPALRSGADGRSPGYRRLSLYTRVLVVNASVLVGATAALAFSPARVPFPTTVNESLLLCLGLAVMVFANAALLRVSFGPLSRLVQHMGTIDLLKPGQRLPVTGGVEVRSVISSFNAMLDRLEQERRESSRRAVHAQDEERRRIGQELHDEIGQRLTGILLQLQRASATAPDGLRAGLLETQEEARSTLDEVGRIAWQLRPGILDDLGLVRALENLASTARDHAGIEVVQWVDPRVCPLPPDIELGVYRVAQESITNALRHADATRIELSLERLAGSVRLRVADDGNGLLEDEMRNSGIRGMRERALLIDGSLQLDARPGAGVTVLLEVPDAARDA